MMKFQTPLNAPNNAKRPVVDIRTELPTNSAYTWITRNGVRDLKNITTIVVHHDAISKASSKSYDDITFAKRIATSHIRSNHNIPGGDPGFPYHIFIRNGNIYICNELEALTYGVASNNKYTIHISVSGNYAGIDSLSTDDRNALYGAILMVKSLIPTITAIKGHKEITKTACPGFSMNQVREDVLNLEEHMSAIDESLQARAYVIALRISQLGNRLLDPKWGFSAVQKLGWLIDSVEGSSVATDVVNTVGTWYKDRQYDKIVELEQVMKDRSLI